VQGDLLAGEAFELADQVTLTLLVVDSRFVVGGAEVAVADLGIG